MARYGPEGQSFREPKLDLSRLLSPFFRGMQVVIATTVLPQVSFGVTRLPVYEILFMAGGLRKIAVGSTLGKMIPGGSDGIAPTAIVDSSKLIEPRSLPWTKLSSRLFEPGGFFFFK